MDSHILKRFLFDNNYMKVEKIMKTLNMQIIHEKIKYVRNLSEY